MRIKSAPVEEVFKTLREKYKSKEPGLKPFDSLIFTILSQRSRDQNTEKAAQKLLEFYPTPEALSKADPVKVEVIVHSTGFYRAKTNGVIEASRVLLERYGGQVPRDLDALLTLPMVGRKTANCVLVYGFGLDAMPVDTHVHRISNRLGWADTKDPDKTEMELRKLVPKKYWKELNSLMIDFGRKTCQPRKPRCSECPVEHICPSSIVPQ